jgi:hypothetical protein
MEITINQNAQWNAGIIKTKSNFYTKWLAVLDSQQPNKTLWYIVSLIAQGVLFLPVPAALIYYFNAPVYILAITLFMYFANIIAGMGGAGIRITLSFFLLSVFVHLTMITVCVV